MGFQKRLRPLAELKFQQMTQGSILGGCLKLGRKLGNCVEILKIKNDLNSARADGGPRSPSAHA
jgi:hypothetical protein